MFPQFGYANGIGYLNLTLGGYVSNPKLKGMAKFQKVQVSLPDQRVNIKETDIELIESHFPDFEIVEIPESSHWVHAESPVQFFDKVSRFLIYY